MGPSHPCCNSRSSPTYPSPLKRNTRDPPISRVAPFPPASSRGGILSLRGRERVPRFPSHLKRRRSPQERREELQDQAPFTESPRCLSPFQGKLFPCTASTFKPRIDSHHGGTWDSPVGKPRGKASWEILEGMPRISCYTRREA